MSMLDEEESQQLQIMEPKAQLVKYSSVIPNWEFKTNLEDVGTLKLYLVVNEVYLQNLKNKKEEPKLTEQQKRTRGSNCLIFQKFQFPWVVYNGENSIGQDYRGELSISVVPYRGLQVIVMMGQLQISRNDNFFAKMIYTKTGESQLLHKTYALNAARQGYNTHSFLIEQKDIQTYLNPKFAIQFTIIKDIDREKKYLGIRNEGNTCYMNSILQILYFLRPLRKQIVESDSDSKLIKVLRDIFFSLMDTNEKSGTRSVDAENLISAFGRFDQFPRRQQDIHQFLLGFIEELENQCPGLRELWLGSSKQILNSMQIDKPYNSTQNQQFSQLDLHMVDHNSNTFGQMIDSLHMLLKQEKVDDKIDTDQFGKISVTKTKQFISLPNVIFFNLKRYQYRKQKNKITKILADLAYPSSVNFGFLLGTPTGDDQEYVLYAVTVHTGQAYNSGHYYSYINTSTNLSKPYWCQFNDSQVFISSLDQALSFTGGKKKTIYWSKQYQRFVQKQYICEDTAYLLVYIRKQKYNEYQQMKTTIPRSYLSKKRQIQAKNEAVTLMDIKVYVAEDKQMSLFEEVDTISLPVCAEENIFSQLRKLENNYLGCRIGSIWKVCRGKKKIKRLIQFGDFILTPSKLFGVTFNRGHVVPDYLLIIPQSQQIFKQSQLLTKSDQKLGLVKTMMLNSPDDSKLNIITKSYLQEFITYEQKRLQRKAMVQDKQRFNSDWNDYCTLIFQS